MFKQLQLTCFRKHESLTLDFQQGLIAIRGLNEAGKSTIQEAIAYALFGSKALRQPFDEVVTWGKSEGDLKVRLTLDSTTVITRSKRGAEVTNTGVLCTGQKECTAYMERLLGASAETAGRLMLASQNQLRGALEGGPTEAAALIEHLADFDLIDRVLEMIQHELPTGNTAGHEANVKRWQETLDNIEIPDESVVSAAAADVEQLNTKLGEDYQNQKAMSTDLQALDMAGARRFMQDFAKVINDESALAPQLVRAREAASVELNNPRLDQDIERWRAELMGLKDRRAAQEAWAVLQKLKEPELMWQGSRDEFRAELDRTARMREEAANERIQLQVRMANAAARRINEKACAFCGKDLTAVPEVLLRNSESDSEVRVLSEKLGVLALTIAGIDTQRQELLAVDQAAHEYETVLNRYLPFIIRKPGTRYPCEWIWIGEPPPPPESAVPDYNANIKLAEQAQIGYQRALGARDAAKAQLVDMEAESKRLAHLRAGGEQQLPQINTRIRAGEQLEQRIAELGVAIEAGKHALTLARERAEWVAQAHQQAVARRETTAAELAVIEADLKALQFNNALVKRVRQARPVISDKLWSVVLASVSQHFSQIRGVQSVITRSDNGFRCDGQAVAGLSGSTLDALGLAIRIALTKTFLPNSRFMLLDEPGAAADDERESNMLGLLAASDFDQVLLITHSALADAFASQVVSL